GRCLQSPVRRYSSTICRASLQKPRFASRVSGQALVVVSHHGSRGETLCQRYKDEGPVVLGHPITSFQKFDDAAGTPHGCYVNYGVTFSRAQPADNVTPSPRACAPIPCRQWLD